MKLRNLIIGLVLGVASTALLTLPALAVAPTGGVTGGAAAARGADQPADLFGQYGTFAQVTNVMLYVIGAVSVVMVIVGGLRYVLSGGDSANVTAAKNTILYAIVGVIVAILAYAAVNFVIGSFAEGGGAGGGGGGQATGF